MIILAGGRATRLGGADKPGLMVGGQTLLAAVISAGRGAGAAPIVVVGPDRPGIAGDSGDGAVRFVREEPPGSGPVPALRRGLEALGDRSEPAAGPGAPIWPIGPVGPVGAERVAVAWVVVLAADLPFLRAVHLRTLLAAADGHDGAVLVDGGGRAQWLAGCWRTTALRRAAGGYAGSSLRGLLGPLRPVSVRVPAGPGEPPPWLDCDTEQDLRRAQDWQARSRPARAQPNSPRPA